MKINEKNLSAYAVSATPVDKEGYLNKRGEVNKNFQRRYFILKGNLLFYFDKKGDKEPLGVVILEGCTIELAEEEEQFCFKILFHGTNNRSYILGAESPESMEQWMKALACSSYDYMKLMVAELQRQLDDIEDTPVPVMQERNSPVAPPRTRHNPFNTPERPARSSNARRGEDALRYFENPSTLHDVREKNHVITFRELHNTYGRPILQDFNIWKKEQRDKLDNASANLITEMWY
ncbi:sesquipedalian-1-like [Anthonomus grandis grandis]|uniref:sesquipedalian-1-like n=1 Tax=Anthonomus grandis grandis TaxID=2921223 RepID=UPI00216525A6|nr:sesquipedalian-1-like [Anthonomus grandis grandis]